MSPAQLLGWQNPINFPSCTSSILRKEREELKWSHVNNILLFIILFPFGEEQYFRLHFTLQRSKEPFLFPLPALPL